MIHTVLQELDFIDSPVLSHCQVIPVLQNLAYLIKSYAQLVLRILLSI